MPFSRICAAEYLGLIPYEAALKLQQMLVQARADGSIPDILVLLQHPSVFTTGRFQGEEDIIVPAERLIREGIAVFHSNRGGSVTYHGPGQLVGYPILDLKENGLGIREYIWKLEEAVIKLLSTLGIKGQRVERYPGGVWVDGEKLCSAGIQVGRYITMHGFALNVSTDLRYFDYIKPCGINGITMTSISKLLGYCVGVETIIEGLLRAFSETFGLKCEKEPERYLNIPSAPTG